jgi:acetyl-CoA carboxylase beta subunit/acetyl-CoA carboxylase alpha subunit
MMAETAGETPGPLPEGTPGAPGWTPGRRVDARTLIARVLDRGSWRSWDTPPHDPAQPGSPYAAELADVRARTGYDEAVITGEGRLRGRRVAVAASEFSFLGGSIGVAAADRLCAAIERATAAGLPLLASPASGGTRMQEGSIAFAQMVKITAAVAGHRGAGLPYLVYLRDPTVGGVFASWGSLGHVTAAAPGALIGFLGPRVYQALHGEPFPAGVQVAENLYTHGLVDAVVSPDEIGGIAARALDVLCTPAATSVPGSAPSPGEPVPVPTWESIKRSRRSGRPGVRTLLKLAAREAIPLQGTGAGENDPGLLLALARFGGAPCVVLGQDRHTQRSMNPVGPAGLRVARRGMRLAEELRLPLLTVVDTPGAVLSREAEESGLAGEIARSLADLVALAAPTVCLILGEGAGGAALALLPADRVICAQHGWLSPLPPEGAAALVHGSTEFAAQIAAAQGVGSADLHRDGIVDLVVPERPDAADEPTRFCRRMATVLEYELSGLLRTDEKERRAARLERYRNLGRGNTR